MHTNWWPTAKWRRKNVISILYWQLQQWWSVLRAQLEETKDTQGIVDEMMQLFAQN